MNKENTNIRWYALKVTANQERKVKEYIEKKIKVENLYAWIPRVEVPTEKYLSMDVNGKKSVREKLILPGYLLVEADLTHGEVSPMLTSISGVYGFLSMTEGKVTNIPAPLRQREVDRFLKVYDEKEELSWSFGINDMVKLLDGPFSSFEGRVSAVDLKREQVSVLVSIFGRETKVDIPIDKVEKIHEKTKTLSA